MPLKSTQKTIVISGINFFEAGPLSVMIDALTCLSKNFSKTHKIIAFVSSKELYNIKNIEFIEFPKSRKSWLFRLYYEYYYFKKISKSIKPDCWLSMHDITPTVICKNQFTYCHNSAPFFKPTFTDIKYGFTTFLFSLFYKYLYRINIKKNSYIIVQQNWLREKFQQEFNISNIIVAYPELEHSTQKNTENNNEYKTLFYPSFPRSFKNFEIICKAYELLANPIKKKLKIYITIDENLNSYSKSIVNKYKKNKGLCFIGLINRDEVFKYYEQVDGLIFPSRLETWGLPITEFKHYNKPILISNLDYAHETIGNYTKAVFFDPYSETELSKILSSFIEGDLIFSRINKIEIKQPFVKGWLQLFEKILNE